MNPKKALNRIGWRFGGNGNQKPFPVNENDIDAFNEVSEYFEKTQKEQYQNNPAFAKMFIFLYKAILERDKTSVFNPEVRKEILMILRKPISQHLEELKQSLNDSDMYVKINKAYEGTTIPKGLRHVHPSRIEDFIDLKDENKKLEIILKFKREKEQAQKEFEKMYKDNPENFIKGDWDIETVTQCIQSEINHALNLNIP